MKPCLPKDFAMKLLDKEIELETSCNIMTLTELVELYRQAIEYYEENKGSKFWDFQERLQKILLKPSVLSLMQEENQKYKETHSMPSSRTRAKTYNASMQQLEKKQSFELSKKEFSSQLKNIVPVSLPNSKTNITKVVKNQQDLTKNLIEKTVNNLKTQEFSLEERLKSRKKKCLNISTDSGYKDLSFQTLPSPMNGNIEGSTSSSFFFEFEDKSLNVSSCGNSEELENIIESIMEANFAEKTERVSEIKVKYETQINEFAGQGSVFCEIIQEMRKKMKEEIDCVTRVLDTKRKDDISKAKSEFLRIC